jgi:hypothetical protein
MLNEHENIMGVSNLEKQYRAARAGDLGDGCIYDVFKSRGFPAAADGTD